MQPRPRAGFHLLPLAWSEVLRLKRHSKSLDETLFAGGLAWVPPSEKQLGTENGEPASGSREQRPALNETRVGPGCGVEVRRLTIRSSAIRPEQVSAQEICFEIHDAGEDLARVGLEVAGIGQTHVLTVGDLERCCVDARDRD